MEQPDPVTRELMRLRQRFAWREAYVMSVAISVGGLALPWLLAPVGLDAGMLIFQLLTTLPLLVSSFYVYRRRRGARALMAYAFLLYAGLPIGTTGHPGVTAFFAVQGATIAALWLPPIDIVMRDSYHAEVIGPVPLAGRRRRAAWTIALTVLWSVGAFVIGVVATLHA
jgi:hypothetical protein